MSGAIKSAITATVTSGLKSLSNVNRKFLKEPSGGHPFLTGIHKPMRSELDVEDLRVDGEIPSSLKGRYLRIGPNPITDPDAASYHWFTGDGMVHGLRIIDGSVQWYKNRWVRSNRVSDTLNEARKPGARNPRTDTANTNVVGIANRTFAVVEAGGKPVELDFNLETIAHNPFDGTLANGFSAHTHVDPETCESHAICYDPAERDKVWHTVLNAQGKVIREEPVEVKDGPSVHDCQITKNHVLVFDLPAVFSLKRFVAGYNFPYEWNTKHTARLGLLGRNKPGSEIVWCSIDEPCYVYHIANAFETEDGKVVVDVVVHESSYEASALAPGGQWARFERWTADPVSQTVERRIIHDHAQEFPRYDERLTSQPYRYAYSVELGRTENFGVDGEHLFKHDLETGTTAARFFGPGCHPGEFVFVPRSPEAGEDEGWLIGLVIDSVADQSSLYILNADDFNGEPQAVIHLEHRIPPGFHGNWICD